MLIYLFATYLLLPLGRWGSKWDDFHWAMGCVNHEKAPSDSPIWQLKKRELLLPLSFLITKPLKLDLSNLHYGPHYKPHYRTQGCVIREDNGSNNSLFLSCQMGLSDGAFFMIKHTPLPNGNHPISSPICPMGVADTLEHVL